MTLILLILATIAAAAGTITAYIQKAWPLALIGTGITLYLLASTLGAAAIH